MSYVLKTRITAGKMKSPQFPKKPKLAPEEYDMQMARNQPAPPKQVLRNPKPKP